MRFWDWDRGRLVEFGLDLRGTWLHRKLVKWFWHETPHPERKQLWRMADDELKAKRLERRMAALSCGCEACWRSFFPWPFSW